MKTHFCLCLVVTAVLVTTTGLADDRAACLDAAAKGQTLRNAHKLVEAREQFRVCALAVCPAVVQTDCVGWLADAERALPTVVLEAKSGSGLALVDVKVSIDGQPLVSKLDGQAVAVNAGPHTFHFEGREGASVDQPAVVNEGEKNQAVAVVLGAAAAPAPSPGPENAADSGGSGTWTTVGWLLGGAGVVGLGVGTGFGIVAIGDKNGADCNANNVCKGSPDAVKNAARVADIAWIAGGVLLASGAAVVLFAPSGRHHEAAAGVRISPVMTASGAEIVAGGSW